MVLLADRMTVFVIYMGCGCRPGFLTEFDFDFGGRIRGDFCYLAVKFWFVVCVSPPGSFALHWPQSGGSFALHYLAGEYNRWFASAIAVVVRVAEVTGKKMCSYKQACTCIFFLPFRSGLNARACFHNIPYPRRVLMNTWSPPDRQFPPSCIIGDPLTFPALHASCQSPAVPGSVTW